jgi:hypothetical protein
MPFTGNYTTNTFKQGLFNGDFDFAVDTIKIALYTNCGVAGCVNNGLHDHW